ncbi:unnamed protein product [Paramecium octaurelia]|uniref:Uncharacterized protein n=1 Tax=Paramecium octaurelia TaxID=43137 RepID=A0A8S1SYB1_PAROT|nr:unnamed protein product [Paramecium octaurelia]
MMRQILLLQHWQQQHQLLQIFSTIQNIFLKTVLIQNTAKIIELSLERNEEQQIASDLLFRIIAHNCCNFYIFNIYIGNKYGLKVYFPCIQSIILSNNKKSDIEDNKLLNYFIYFLKQRKVGTRQQFNSSKCHILHLYVLLRQQINNLLRQQQLQDRLFNSMPIQPQFLKLLIQQENSKLNTDYMLISSLDSSFFLNQLYKIHHKQQILYQLILFQQLKHNQKNEHNSLQCCCTSI